MKKLGDLLKVAKKDEISQSQAFSSEENSPISIPKFSGGLRASKARSYFLAKKVEDSELHAAKEEKLATQQELTQISEDPREVSPKNSARKSFTQTSSAFALNPDKERNIFEVEMIHSSKYQENYKGPFFHNGKVVKHSVVGPANLFEKHQMKLQRQVKRHDSDASSMTMTESLITPKNPLLSILQTPDVLQLSILPSLSTRKFESKRKEPKKIPQVPKRELIEKIDEMKTRQANFYKELGSSINNLKHCDALYLTKEERCMQKFEKTQEEWSKFMDKANTKLGRPLSQSIIRRGEDHRAKSEQAEALEIVKSDLERFGENVWRMTLRKDGEDGISRNIRTEEERPQTVGMSVRERPTHRPNTATVEIIRSPRTVASPGSTWRASFFRTSNTADRSMREYLQDRVKKKRSKLENVIASGEGIEQLTVWCLQRN